MDPYTPRLYTASHIYTHPMWKVKLMVIEISVNRRIGFWKSCLLLSHMSLIICLICDVFSKSFGIFFSVSGISNSKTYNETSQIYSIGWVHSFAHSCTNEFAFPDLFAHRLLNGWVHSFSHLWTFFSSYTYHSYEYILPASVVVQLARTSSIIRVVMSSSPDWSENFLIFHITRDPC